MIRLPRNLRTSLEEFVATNPQEIKIDVPGNLLDFIERYQPNIGKKIHNFELAPFWNNVLLDNHPNIMLVCGRQTYKTTNCSSLIAWTALKHPGSEVSYVADDEQHKGAFSEARLRNEVFLSNRMLRQFLPHGKANVGRIKLTVGSTIYLLTDESHYHQVEGKSNKVLILDETQVQDVGFLPVAMYSLSATKGRFYCFGIGGEAGSEYHKLWKRTDQREWIYDDKYWRERLRFDGNGNITNGSDSLKSILSGKWVPRAPENTNFRGYHIPQSLFPTIPLTIHDAQTKYNTHPELSVEYQQKHYPSSMFLSHTLGEFYKAERRPITPEMVERCYIHYLSLLKPEEVSLLKQAFQDEIRIVAGIDWGSGASGASATVVSILIKWKKSNRYQLVWIEKRPQEHQLDQCQYIVELLRKYQVQYAVADYGYGETSVLVCQRGGRNSKDEKFEGFGRSKFVGCRTISDETKPNLEYKQETDEKGTVYGKITIDKTTVIQNFIDFIGKSVPHPLFPKDEKKSRPQFMIPAKNDWETSHLVDAFCSITRKDLEKNQEIIVEDTRNKAKKLFNHPNDFTMSIIYSMVADRNFDPNAYRISPVRRKF